MNTDKLMELERKWRAEAEQYKQLARMADEAGFSKTAYERRSIARDYTMRADELAAALRAEQAVGEEQIARELLAEEYERVNMEPLAKLVRNGHFDPAIPAIRRALGTARQSCPANPVPAPWIEAGGLMARICETKYGVGISYNCDEAITTFRDFFARQSEGMVLREVPGVIREMRDWLMHAEREDGTQTIELADVAVRDWERRLGTALMNDAGVISAAPGGEGEE